MNRGRRTLETTVPSLPEGNIRLRDGRRLAYAEYGDPQGKPVFFFHGTPGSRLFHHPDDSVAASAGARIIAVDRPGFGRSDFKPGRTLLDWPSDVVQLADALDIQRFAVMGYSGGGPYAAVCASSIPERLTAAGLVSSIAPLDTPQITRGMQGVGHMYFSLERHLPPLAKLGCWLMCTAWRHNPDLYFRSQINGLRNSEEAQALLPKIKAMMVADFMEALRAGTRGITWDLDILARPWGFHLHVITADVLLWHGEGDTQAPLVMGKRLGTAIPQCRATFFPREGHWAIYGHWQEILTALVQSETALRERPRSATTAVTTQNNSFGSETVVSPDSSDTALVDTPADSFQGLQPAREVAKVVPTQSAEGSTVILADTPSSVSAEPEPAPESPKPTSKKTAKRRSGAVEVAPAVVSPEPKPVQEAPKPVSKKTAGRRTGSADTSAKVSPEPEPAQKPPRPVSKKTSGRGTTAIADAPTQASDKVKPAPEKTKTAAEKTARRSAAAKIDAPIDDSSEPKTPPDKARLTAKRPAKPRPAVIEPLSIVTPKGPHPVHKPVEPTSKKVSSGRKAAKEAVLV
jgi:pimeloyl-ACP methyl ester carboxylesterase